MIPVTMSRGNSPTAQYLDSASQATEQYFRESAAFSKQPAYDELVAVWDECKIDNWDGCNAFPVQEQTFVNTYFFIEARRLALLCHLLG